MGTSAQTLDFLNGDWEILISSAGMGQSREEGPNSNFPPAAPVPSFSCLKYFAFELQNLQSRPVALLDVLDPPPPANISSAGMGKVRSPWIPRSLSKKQAAKPRQRWGNLNIPISVECSVLCLLFPHPCRGFSRRLAISPSPSRTAPSVGYFPIPVEDSVVGSSFPHPSRGFSCRLGISLSLPRIPRARQSPKGQGLSGAKSCRFSNRTATRGATF